MALSAAPSLVHKPAITEVKRLIDRGDLESWDAQKILTWALENLHPRLSLSASFGAPEGMVLLDMMHRLDATARVFVLDTGRLAQATHDLIDRVRERYGKQVEVLYPRADDLQEMVGENGVNLFYESLEKRKLCCRVRKVEPMRRYLATLDGYLTGLRRDQNVTRTNTPKVMLDRSYGGIVKLNPIADWTQDQVWQYVRKHDVPVNRLHANGFPSVGCEPCTRAIEPGEDERAGRWWWENPDTKECGLHEQGGGI